MDWDDAYANGAHIEGAEAFPVRWDQHSAALRGAVSHDVLRYGPHPRMEVELLFPKGDTPRGLMVFIHGGYWLGSGRGSWSFLAKGALDRGYVAAIPGYPLCPEVSMPQITQAAARAVQMAADAVPGPVRIAGHSAGGHLAARMGDPKVELPCRDRIARIVSISPLGDLRPLMRTKMAGPLQLTDAVCAAESPALHAAPAAPVTIWVGAEERPVFLEQARGLAEAWGCACEVEAGKHHFNVIDGLAQADHPLCAALFN